jgi:hypothetical protein
MNLREIAQSEPFRVELAEVLKNTTLLTALQALAEDNLPDLEIKVQVPGMSAMEAIALDAAKRAGAQSMIRRLKNLPYLGPRRMDAAHILSKPWEWITPEDVSATSPSPTSKKLRKPTP